MLKINNFCVTVKKEYGIFTLAFPMNKHCIGFRGARYYIDVIHFIEENFNPNYSWWGNVCYDMYTISRCVLIQFAL